MNDRSFQEVIVPEVVCIQNHSQIPQAQTRLWILMLQPQKFYVESIKAPETGAAMLWWHGGGLNAHATL